LAANARDKASHLELVPMQRASQAAATYDTLPNNYIAVDPTTGLIQGKVLVHPSVLVDFALLYQKQENISPAFAQKILILFKSLLVKELAGLQFLQEHPYLTATEHKAADLINQRIKQFSSREDIWNDYRYGMLIRILAATELHLERAGYIPAVDYLAEHLSYEDLNAIRDHLPEDSLASKYAGSMAENLKAYGPHEPNREWQAAYRHMSETLQIDVRLSLDQARHLATAAEIERRHGDGQFTWLADPQFDSLRPEEVEERIQQPFFEEYKDILHDVEIGTIAGVAVGGLFFAHFLRKKKIRAEAYVLEQAQFKFLRTHFSNNELSADVLRRIVLAATKKQDRALRKVIKEATQERQVADSQLNVIRAGLKQLGVTRARPFWKKSGTGLMILIIATASGLGFERETKFIPAILATRA
jgi:hypothetical protein